MKSIFIDTNSIDENGNFYINEIIAKNMKLRNGEKVVAYQDGDSWEAKIVCCENKWELY